ncbi:ESPR-type extended signal peptide-containing protein, partial [Escherichia coli]|uniref:ESPR-type extended signal peptide-containing protein n=1 Tax=Escherichia coli TaxID=562 RepID=UPI00288BE11E
MNKAYSVVWNHARQTWIVVSELSRCHGVVLAKKTILTLAVEGANKRGNTSRLTQSFHFFMFEPIFSPVNALNQP